MRAVERTNAAGRATSVLAALVALVALAAAGCGSSGTTATAPTTSAPVVASTTTSSDEADDTDTTATPGAVSGAAALGRASGAESEDGDASALDDTSTDDTTYDEGILTETGADEVAVDVTWATSAVDYRGQDGVIVAYECPPDGTFGTVWGTDAYTDDSSVCTAAVHLGLINEIDGGIVAIQISAGLDAYEGSEANGVTTGSYGPWLGTFTFV